MEYYTTIAIGCFPNWDTAKNTTPDGLTDTSWYVFRNMTTWNPESFKLLIRK
jgi:hypothetical protein